MSLDWALYLIIALLGVSVGSFLNVVLFRMGSGKGLSGRSRCLHCGRTLTPRMLVPLFSFLFQGGRCAFCRARLDMQYPLVELASGSIWLTAFVIRVDTLNPIAIEGLIRPLFEIAIFTTLLLIFVYDIRHKIIPDRFSGMFALLTFTILLFWLSRGEVDEIFIPLGFTLPPWSYLLSGPLLALLFFLLWRFSGGRAIGLGDAKLMFGVGWLLGPTGGLTALVLSFWIAFIPSIALLLFRSRSYSMKSEIPFAPFIVLGTAIVYVTGLDIIKFTF